jgi:hypothetical protein
MTDFAFDVPVLLHSPLSTAVATAEEAARIVRSCLQERFTMAGLTALLMLERAAEGAEVAEARQAFWSWASNEQLLVRRGIPESGHVSNCENAAPFSVVGT